jgi:hypothetical protein
MHFRVTPDDDKTERGEAYKVGDLFSYRGMIGVVGDIDSDDDSDDGSGIKSACVFAGLTPLCGALAGNAAITDLNVSDNPFSGSGAKLLARVLPTMT